ncbi:MAG: sulfotransferase [Chitinophagales bacterium]|nr:sulfotransferase [Chitinophagales bacterium]
MKSQKASPILVIGTQRSGSNLLRLILNQSPHIEAPHPPHILQTFYPLLPRYGNLQEAQNFLQLCTDVAAFVATNPVPWENIDLNPQTIFEQSTTPTLIEIFKTIYELKANHKKANYWCCKSMGNTHYIPQIEAAGLRPIYIYLVRDGRDVAASFKKAVVGEKHIYFIAQQWLRDQQAALQHTRAFAPHRTFQIHYENFIQNPQASLQPLLNMLHIPWTDSLLEYYQSIEAQQTAQAGEMWQNVVKPIDKTNTKNYHKKLSQHELNIFQTVCGSMLRKLGYDVDSFEEIHFDATTIAQFEIENRILKEEIKESAVIDAAARKSQDEVLYGIVKRLKQQT